MSEQSRYVTVTIMNQSVCPACQSPKRDGYHNTRKIDCGEFWVIRRRTRCRSCGTPRLELLREKKYSENK